MRDREVHFEHLNQFELSRRDARAASSLFRVVGVPWDPQSYGRPLLRRPAQNTFISGDLDVLLARRRCRAGGKKINLSFRVRSSTPARKSIESRDRARNDVDVLGLDDAALGPDHRSTSYFNAIYSEKVSLDVCGIGNGAETLGGLLPGRGFS